MSNCVTEEHLNTNSYDNPSREKVVGVGSKDTVSLVKGQEKDGLLAVNWSIAK